MFLNGTLLDRRWAKLLVRLVAVEKFQRTYLLTGGRTGAAAICEGTIPEGGKVSSAGAETDPLAELRLLKTLLARRTNLDRPLRSSSWPPDPPPGAEVLMVTVFAQVCGAQASSKLECELDILYDDCFGDIIASAVDRFDSGRLV